MGIALLALILAKIANVGIPVVLKEIIDYLKPKWLGPSKITHPNIHAYDCVLTVLTPHRNAHSPSGEVLNTNAIFTAPFFTAQ